MAVDLLGNFWVGDSLHFGALNKPFWARLTAYDGSTFYAWEEWVAKDSATFQVLNGGRTGTVTINPAFVPNGTVIALTSIVQLQRAYFHPTNQWVYAVLGTASTGGAGFNLTVEDSSGGTVIANVTTIITVTGDFNLTNPSAGHAQIAKRFSGFKAALSADVSIPDTVGATLNQWTVGGSAYLFDTDSYYVNTSTFHLPFVGYYEVIINLGWEPSATGGRVVLGLHDVGGNQVIAHWMAGATTGSYLYQSQHVSGIFYSSAILKTFQVFAVQDSGGPLNVYGGILLPMPTTLIMTFLGY